MEGTTQEKRRKMDGHSGGNCRKNIGRRKPFAMRVHMPASRCGTVCYFFLDS